MRLTRHRPTYLKIRITISSCIFVPGWINAASSSPSSKLHFLWWLRCMKTFIVWRWYHCRMTVWVFSSFLILAQETRNISETKLAVRHIIFLFSQDHRDGKQHCFRRTTEPNSKIYTTSSTSNSILWLSLQPCNQRYISYALLTNPVMVCVSEADS